MFHSQSLQIAYVGLNNNYDLFQAEHVFTKTFHSLVGVASTPEPTDSVFILCSWVLLKMEKKKS